MSDRERIFSAIRSALEPLPSRAAKPEWEDDLVVSRAPKQYPSLKAHFADRLAFVGGKFFDDAAALAQFLRDAGSVFGFCDPELERLVRGWEGIRYETKFDMSKINEYAFGVTKAACAIAESGTIVLKDSLTAGRLSALAPWVHIAVVREADIVPHIPAAIERFGDDPSIVFATGPSKTADVEGILIEGVHGPGVQIALCV